jgi:hypothetical protein
MNVVGSLSVLFVAMVLAGCRGTSDAKPEVHVYWICSTDFEFFETGAMVRELASHGITCERGGGIHFMSTGVIIRGSLNDAFRARDVILENVRGRGWIVTWPADGIILPDDPSADKRKPLTPQSLVRLVNVDYRLTPTIRVMEFLNRNALEAEIFFGDRIDVVAVHQGDLDRAVALLQGERFPGLELPGAHR